MFLRNISLDRVDVSCVDSGGICDHELIIVHLSKSIPHSRETDGTGEASYVKVDWEKFRNALQTVDIQTLLSFEDPDSILDRLYNLLDEIRNNMSSIRSVRRKQVPLKPRIYLGLLRSIGTRNKLWRWVKSCPQGPYARQTFNGYRNKLCECVREKERRFLVVPALQHLCDRVFVTGK